jgi:hypothetical protein
MSQPATARPSPAGLYVDEALIHGTFAEFRLIGEWFSPEPELLDFIEALDYQDEIPSAVADAELRLERRRRGAA